MKPKERHHISFFPLVKGLELPDENEKGAGIRWSEALYNRLLVEAEVLYFKSSLKSGMSYCIAKLEDLYYLVVCMENEFHTFNDTVYILKSLHDCKIIQKMLESATDYKARKGIIDEYFNRRKSEK